MTAKKPLAMAFKAFPAFALMHSVQFSKKTNSYYCLAFQAHAFLSARHYVSNNKIILITFLVLVYMTFGGFLAVAVRMFYRNFCIPKDSFC